MVGACVATCTPSSGILSTPACIIGAGSASEVGGPDGVPIGRGVEPPLGPDMGIGSDWGPFSACGSTGMTSELGLDPSLESALDPSPESPSPIAESSSVSLMSSSLVLSARPVTLSASTVASLI